MAQTRREFLRSAAGSAAALLTSQLPLGSVLAQSPRPNILWLIAEDLCPDLGCYGNALVHTPNLDRLASEGIRYTNAFTTAPVCSPSRSALMTGMYQTSIGAHNHRSHRRDNYHLPEGVRLVTDILRQAGYFTANVIHAAPGVKGTGKTDFNFTAEHPFDGSDWSQRQPGQPFFAQVNFREAHRPFEHDREHPVDPEAVEIPPYYPDHPITRRDWAAYLETINILDRKIGAVLSRLDQEGLRENTVVIFFADHGRAHVRAKQWLYDGGIHIPLIVRWPGHMPAGEVRDELVSAIDITAATLALAGVQIPPTMQGRPFLDPQSPERDAIYAARDRCDETVDRIRCVRTKRFKYIRNFYPDRPYTQLNRYKETMYPVIRLMRRLAREGKLSAAQARFMAPSRPTEELYDLEHDPWEIHNLAGDPKYQDVLVELRQKLLDWMRTTQDQGAIPEDPAVIAYYEERARKRYDHRLKVLYSREGMRWEDYWGKR